MPSIASLTKGSARDRGRRLNGSLVASLGKDIVDGRFRPGERFSCEATNHRNLNVSRSSYREAVKALEAKGLVETKASSGTIVRPRKHWNLEPHRDCRRPFHLN
ncbi:FadR/GntR family transcriptional regulator [Sphingobium salicis]|uniref:FadR/GntR family transcriptional regulator n=1 Tax=unclassified Sphingobium TaxID=2611147 RepID=UPI003C30899E